LKRLYGGLLLATFILFAPATEVAGQILNIEKFRLDSLNRENPFRFKLEANFDVYNRSATEDERAEFVEIGTDLNMIYAPGSHLYMMVGEISYVENNAAKILNNGNVHLRSTLNYRGTFCPEFFAQAQYDDFRGLAERYLLGGALRWITLREDKILLTLGAGPMYEYEKWRVPESSEVREVDFIKLSTNLILRWSIGDHLDFNTTLYYQVGYDEEISSARNRFSNATNLNFQITDKISFKTGLRFAYEDRPIVPITKFIYSIENGISLNF